MNTIKKNSRILVLVTALVTMVALITVWAIHLSDPARAAGIADKEPMLYAGQLADGSGTPLKGTSHKIKIALWATQTGGTSSLCETTTVTKDLSKTNGRFRISLPDGCVGAVHQDPTTWVEVTVDSTALPRTQVGAAPYAVEADDKCPRGYSEDTTAPTSITLCKRGSDEMVKVGDFWVDRYEMSIVDSNTWAKGKCSGTGTRCGAGQCGAGTKDDYPPGFPDSAKVTTVLYACSRSGNTPSRMMTWFQAQAACTFAGKHLCTNGEWQAVAFGTPDPISPGANDCNISTSAAEKAGSRKLCVSQHGAYDMVGNLWEWVDLWGQAGIIDQFFTKGAKADPWPAGYGDGEDRTWNVNGKVSNPSDEIGAPFAALRGGGFTDKINAGVFALDLAHGPAAVSSNIGSRCCRSW